MIEIQFDDRAIRAALAEIGEALLESTKARFPAQTGPDGRRWAANSPVTIARKGRNPPRRLPQPAVISCCGRGAAGMFQSLPVINPDCRRKLTFDETGA